MDTITNKIIQTATEWTQKNSSKEEELAREIATIILGLEKRIKTLEDKVLSL